MYGSKERRKRRRRAGGLIEPAANCSGGILKPVSPKSPWSLDTAANVRAADTGGEGMLWGGRVESKTSEERGRCREEEQDSSFSSCTRKWTETTLSSSFSQERAVQLHLLL